jgi:malate dehydrogenase (oxaloacetate-decarboxylating)(NADP+)
VFHDDQHGTAIITGAALLNAVEISGKKIDELQVVVNGAGAAGISCSDFYIRLGVKKENILLCDTRGVIYKGREKGMNEYKAAHAVETTKRTLADAVQGADLFLGLSVGGALSPEMLKTMNKNPIVFACANPDPEILPKDAHAVRPDVIMATGRSDFPNQVNNVLGFPFIFRGALDVDATDINEEMKLAGARALAALARKEVPRSVLQAYGLQSLSFGKDYLIPKPFDSRVFIDVSIAIAEAAVSSGVAQATYPGREAYQKILEERYARSITRFNT